MSRGGGSQSTPKRNDIYPEALRISSTRSEKNEGSSGPEGTAQLNDQGKGGCETS